MEADDSALENDAPEGSAQADVPPMETDSAITTSSESLDGLVLSRAHFRDLGPLASWTVSSSKPGHGISMVQDASLETFWQSDGPQPHFINIHFPRLVAFKFLSIYLNFALDESYTPSSIRVMSGMGYHTLLEVQTLEFQEPTGWHHIDLTQQLGPRGRNPFIPDEPEGERGFETRLVQLQILANHQNGKDTHVRAIKLHAAQPKSVVIEGDIVFETLMFDEESLVR